MNKYDKINPIRTIDSVMKFLLKPLLNNRGEIDAGSDDGGGNGGDGGDGGDSWRTNLPPEIKDHPSLQSFKTPADVAKSWVEAQKLIGADKIIMPSKDANDEEWNERVFNRLGRPKTPDEYTLPTDLEIPKELPLDENLMKGFKNIAHKMGLLPRQVNEVYRWYMGNLITQFNESNKKLKEAMSESETKLRTEWGAAYDQNVNLARKVLNKFGTPEVVENLIGGKGNDPALIKMLAEIGKVLSEDQLAGKPKTLTMTPDEAAAEVSKINNDKNHPYWIADHPEHKAAVDKMNALMAMVHPA